jgi:NitT/TauT family transport system ATP-binding protein
MTVAAAGTSIASHPTPDAVEPVVALRSVGKEFATRSRERFVALDDVELEIWPGEFLTLIGPSGCGKSTVLRLIADLIQPTRGEVAVAGTTARNARLGREYGMVFQQPTLLDWRTVRGNVELPLQLMGYGASERARRAEEMLRLVKLHDFADHRPWQLSGGMQQRVSIARALAFEPRLLLMDEPFGALDEMTREHLQMELLGIWERVGTTVVFVTHSIPEAVFLSQRVIVMATHPGRIRVEVPIDLRSPRTEDTREDPAFFEALTRLRDSLHAGESAST